MLPVKISPSFTKLFLSLIFSAPLSLAEKKGSGGLGNINWEKQNLSRTDQKMKKKQSKVHQKTQEHSQEHLHWDYDPTYVSDPADLPRKRGIAGLVDFKSICGGADESQPVELYDGTLGVPVDFVRQFERPVGQIQWRDDLRDRYDKPGNVSGIRWASGTLIGRDLFLTAGHVFDQRPGSWQVPRRNGSNEPIDPEEIATNMKINFNYQLDATGRLQPGESYPILELLEYRRGGLDYAIVRVGGHPGDKYGFTGLAEADSTEGDMLCIIQHPEGQPKRIDAGPQFHAFGDRIGYDSIDTLGGSSGSGILQERTGLIVGVHTNGGCHLASFGHNYGYKITSIAKVSTVLKGLDSEGWIHQDVNRLSGAPQAAGRPAAFLEEEHLVVIYRTGTGHLHLLERGRNWKHTAITSNPGIQRAVGNPAAYPLSGPSWRFVTYRGRDQAIHQLWWNGAWQYLSISEQAGAPPAASDPTPLISPDGTSQQIFFIDDNGHLILLWWDGNWHHANISHATGAPPFDGRPATAPTPEGQTIYVACSGKDKKVHLLRREGTHQWYYEAAAEDAGAPSAIGDPAIAVVPHEDRPRLYYRAGGGRLIQVHWYNRWLYSDLTAAADAPPVGGEPAAAFLAGNPFPTIAYENRDGHLVRLYWSDDRWQAESPSQMTGAPKLRSAPLLLVRQAANHLYLIYRGKDDHIHELTTERI